MTTIWQQVTVRVNKSQTEPVEDALLNLGACSVTFSDAEDQPQYEPAIGETKLWDATNVTGLFEDHAPLLDIQTHLLSEQLITSANEVQLETLEDQVWERAWMKDFKPMQFGEKLWICPTGFTVDATDALIIDLDPGLAFGTGTHPTTALCLEWLDRNPPTNKTVIDYGCGSGILAIAAAKLGATQCAAVDIDPQAIEATLINAENNQVTQHIACYLPEQFQPFKADTLIANILAAPLVTFAELFSTLIKPGGQIALSGILEEQTNMVLEAYHPYFNLQPLKQQGDWILITGELKR